MNRSCAKCGLIFKTETPKTFNLCYRCFILLLEKLFMSILPYLYEMSDEKLNDLIGLCNTTHECAVQERTKRDGYVSRLLARMEDG